MHVVLICMHPPRSPQNPSIPSPRSRGSLVLFCFVFSFFNTILSPPPPLLSLTAFLFESEN